MGLESAIPASWAQERELLDQLVPPGVLRGVIEYWLDELSAQALSLSLRADDLAAFSALGAKARRLTGKRPQVMTDQRKMSFSVEPLGFMVFGADGDVDLQLYIRKRHEQDAILAGAARLSSELAWLPPVAAAEVRSAARWRMAGEDDGGWVELLVADPQRLAEVLSAQHPDLAIYERGGLLRVQRGVPRGG